MATENGAFSIFLHKMPSPVGPIYLAVDKNGAVVQISFIPFEEAPQTGPLAGTRMEWNRYACGELAYQLTEYFHGRLRHFDLEINLHGTQFQLDVWNRLQKVNYGSTMTYGEIARKIGRKFAAQAVGKAVGSNPVPIIIPCHRVVPKSGGIGEYMISVLDRDRGHELKEFLLELEDRYRTNPA